MKRVPRGNPGETIPAEKASTALLTRAIAEIVGEVEPRPVDDIALYDTADGRLDLEAFVEREEVAAELRQAIQRANLTPKERQVLKMHLAGKTAVEIAAETGRAAGTIRATLFHARSKLSRARAAR